MKLIKYNILKDIIKEMQDFKISKKEVIYLESKHKILIDHLILLSIIQAIVEYICINVN